MRKSLFHEETIPYSHQIEEKSWGGWQRQGRLPSCWKETGALIFCADSLFFNAALFAVSHRKMLFIIYFFFLFCAWCWLGWAEFSSNFSAAISSKYRHYFYYYLNVYFLIIYWKIRPRQTLIIFFKWLMTAQIFSVWHIWWWFLLQRKFVIDNSFSQWWKHKDWFLGILRDWKKRCWGSTWVKY